MKLLIHSPAFHPKIGGIETVMELLAAEFTKAGHQVTVATRTPDDPQRAKDFPFAVLRCPSFWQLVLAVRNCDVLIQANVSLPGLLPLLIAPRPWVATHHAWYDSPTLLGKIKEWLKRKACRLASANISVSNAVARHLGCDGHVIPNPYDSAVFRQIAGIPRDRDLVCLGRLVSDKGMDVLIEALGLLKRRGLAPDLTIIGSGPELEPLESQARKLGVLDQIRFAGVLRGEQLARELNRHRILVVPSTWNEPFGIVALEGIACGCMAIGSSGGGLPEAIGPCGVTFPNRDSETLAEQLSYLLAQHATASQTQLSAHLARHQPIEIARRYLDVIRPILCDRQPLAAKRAPLSPANIL